MVADPLEFPEHFDEDHTGIDGAFALVAAFHMDLLVLLGKFVDLAFIGFGVAGDVDCLLLFAGLFRHHCLDVLLILMGELVQLLFALDGIADVVFVFGMLLGIFIAPVKNGVTIGSYNGNFDKKHEEDEFNEDLAMEMGELR